MFHYTSLAIPLLILLPNALFLLYPPKDRPEGVSKGHILYQVTEGVGRVGVIAAPLFYPMHWEKTAGTAGATGMLLFLGIYLYCWGRYIVRKSNYAALYIPLLTIPVPMAWHGFGGWKKSLFGDMHAYGTEGVRFYTKQKSIMQRWSESIEQGAEFAMPVSK